MFALVRQQSCTVVQNHAVVAPAGILTFDDLFFDFDDCDMTSSQQMSSNNMHQGLMQSKKSQVLSTHKSNHSHAFGAKVVKSQKKRMV